MRQFKLLLTTLCVAVPLLLQHNFLHAAEVNNLIQEKPAQINFKLTPSYYSASDGNDAVDINLRANTGPHTTWLGFYKDSKDFQQARTGYEYAPDFAFIHPVFSAQLATRGFIGGSISAQIGNDTYGILGIGRTNLRDYYNLNFDPNDAITFGFGTKVFIHHEFSIFQVFDDRLGTKQRNTHFVWRYKPDDTQRLTVDTSFKSGLDSDNEFVSGYGLSIDYGYKQYFARIARDQYANFNAPTLTKFTLGMRF